MKSTTTSSGRKLKFTARTEIVQACCGYPVAVRRWSPRETIDAQIVILHGIISHSEWLRPIAELLAERNIEVICPDRRGTGLNTIAPGDAPNVHSLVEDIEFVRKNYIRPNVPMHIAGFCWGATYAISCVEKHPKAFRSLVLIAPSLFPSADIATKSIVVGESPDPTEEPLVPIDRFTTGAAFKNYILPDKLRTRRISPRFNSIMSRMTSLIAPRWVRLTIPSCMILAASDRLADNDKHMKAFKLSKARSKRNITVVGEHGLQFDAPGETAQVVLEWLAFTRVRRSE